MAGPSAEFEAYLAPGESVVTGSSGSLYDDPYRSDGSVAVTDRRVLFVSEDGGFVDVAHDAIDSIRSRPRSTIVYRGLGHALVALLGVLVAASAFVGALLVEPSALALLFGLLTVGGVVAAERVRRHGVGSIWERLRAASERIPTGAPRRRISDVLDRLVGPDRLDREGSVVDGPTEADGDEDLLVVGLVSLALVGSIGLIVVVESLLVVPLSLAALGSLALSEYAYRRLRDQETVGRSRRPEREVSIHLADGSVVRLWVDPDGRFDRDLSAQARESARPEAAAELTSP